MRFLLTGGAGFIGSHLADALLARGDRVVLFDDLSTGRLRNVEHLVHGSFADRVEFAEGSVKDYPTVSALVERTDVTAVIRWSTRFVPIRAQPSPPAGAIGQARTVPQMPHTLSAGPSHS